MVKPIHIHCQLSVRTTIRQYLGYKKHEKVVRFGFYNNSSNFAAIIA
jgi:hypothetical protein